MSAGLAPVLLASALVLLALPVSAYWPNSPVTNVPVCVAPEYQSSVTTLTDGEGGVFVAWTDGRDFRNQVYVMRLDQSGRPVPGWPADGLLLSGPRSGYNPQMITDGQGGVIVAWDDFVFGPEVDIYAQRATSTGSIAPGWPASGVPLCSVTGIQQVNTICSDGSGGAIVAWEDYRGGGFDADVYAQHVRGDGSIALGWPTAAAGGAPVCVAANAQLRVNAVGDGAGGAYIAWQDLRSGIHVYVQRVTGEGYPPSPWPANGVPVCASLVDASEGNSRPGLVADGLGGLVIVWDDWRAGGGLLYDLYAQHLQPNASRAAGWPADGIPVCLDTGHPNTNRFFAATGDGTGGALIAWEDGRASTRFDIYAQRIRGDGSIAPGWPSAASGGAPLCTVAGDQRAPSIVADQLGGAIVAWHDARGGATDIYAQHILGDGSIAPGWNSAALGGIAVSTAPGSQQYPSGAGDGKGGAVFAWSDGRTASGDVYAQRITRAGSLAPEPRLTAVQDVRNDQGGKVRVSWLASPLDAYPASAISRYWVWKQVPAWFGPVGAPGSSAVPVRTATRRQTVTNGVSFFWELAGDQAAHQLGAYSLTVATTSDSNATGNPRTVFMVEAEEPLAGAFWASDPDSGYSVDNLPPSSPAPFTAAYESGATHLHWGANAEPDFSHYRMYRGGTAAFVPGPGNLVATTSDTGLVDVGPAGRYYKLAAVDVNGNQSVYASLSPAATLDAGDRGGLAFALEPVHNPSSGGRLSVRFSLPMLASAKLEVLDVGGRRVGLREVGVLGAGWHELVFGEGQQFQSGIYFVRLTQGARMATLRVTVLD